MGVYDGTNETSFHVGVYKGKTIAPDGISLVENSEKVELVPPV